MEQLSVQTKWNNYQGRPNWTITEIDQMDIYQAESYKQVRDQANLITGSDHLELYEMTKLDDSELDENGE